MGEKTMCKFGKSDFDSKAYRKAIGSASYYCGKCGRAADSKKCVCKPIALKSKKKASEG